MPERCHHANNLYANRAEYCEKEAEGDVEVVAELIEALVYDEYQNAPIGSYTYEDESDSQGARRRYEYFVAETCNEHPKNLPLTRNKAILRHTLMADKVQYEVTLGWRLTYSNDIEMIRAYETYYVINIGADGTVQAAIDEPDMVAQEGARRPMTPYDCAQLIMELNTIVQLNQAEARDNDLTSNLRLEDE